MKTLTMRDLSRKTASVLDALERGETFGLRRHGRAVGYLTHTTPPPDRTPDWRSHLDWLKRLPKGRGQALLAEFEEDRRRLAGRENTIGDRP